MMSAPFLVGPLLSFMTDTVVLLTSVNEYVVTMANCMNHMLVICIVVTLASFYRKNMYLNFPIYSIFSCLQLFWVPKIDDRKTNTVHLLLSLCLRCDSSSLIQCLSQYRIAKCSCCSLSILIARYVFVSVSVCSKRLRIFFKYILTNQLILSAYIHNTINPFQPHSSMPDCLTAT